jgi:hypothetical protein
MPTARKQSIPDKPYKENSEAVQAHLSIAQSVIQRMASNSAGCKAWCITLVSAILVVVAQQGKPHFALLAIVPILLFGFLDTYYLSLEKRFRNAYNKFIDKLHGGEIKATDLYAIEPHGKVGQAVGEAILSPSIYPFYIVLLALVVIAMFVIGIPNKTA